MASFGEARLTRAKDVSPERLQRVIREAGVTSNVANRLARHNRFRPAIPIRAAAGR
jgi:hypothetical protein